MTKTNKIDRSKHIIVDLNRQLLYLYQNGEAISTLDCVSGDSDHKTPTGIFTIIRKVNPCFSNEFQRQMNYALFFTNRGHAIHQGVAVGLLTELKYIGFESIGSHGCVRLSESDAKWVFGWAPVGTHVKIVDTLPTTDI